MKLSAFCPVSDKKINEKVARINAIFTTLLLIVFAFTHNIIPVLFLLTDFLLRASDNSQLSLLAISSKSIVRNFSINSSTVNAGPKIFAARIGAILSGLIVFGFLINNPVVSFVIAGVLGVFSFLEGVFGICVACIIYPYVYNIFYRK